MQISLSFPDDQDGLSLVGKQRVVLQASPGPVKFELYMDDKLVWTYTPGYNPCTFTWDTTKISDGTHVIRAEAVYKSRRSKTQAAVSVKNAIQALPKDSFGSGSFGEGPFGGSSAK